MSEGERGGGSEPSSWTDKSRQLGNEPGGGRTGQDDIEPRRSVRGRDMQRQNQQEEEEE